MKSSRPETAARAGVLEKYRNQWEALGSHDPYWAVLTDPAKRNGGWDRGAFFATGEDEIAALVADLQALQVRPAAGVALDFGCGVGRLSRALASRFERVIGIDISEAMLAEARAQNATLTNIEFVHNKRADLSCIAGDSVDLVYSNIVLQHIPAGLQCSYIEEFCRILRPGGVAVFQTPSHHDLSQLHGWIHRLAGNGLLNLARRVLHGRHGVMEVHTLPKEDVLSILDRLGMALVSVEQNNATGRGFCSFRYIVRKKSV